MTRPRKAVGALLLAALAFAGLVGAAEPAGASTISVATPIRLCTNLADTTSCYAWSSFPAGTQVTMRCFRDQSSYGGTVRWFWVDGPGKQGFVSASSIPDSSQVPTPHCDNPKSNYNAVRFAGSKLRETSYTGGHCNCVINSVGACLQFVHDAHLFAGRHIGHPNTARAWAIDFWNAPPTGVKRTRTQVGGSTQAPVGALVFWSGTRRSPKDTWRSASVTAGAITTDQSTLPGTAIQVVNIATRNAAIGVNRYLGWIEY